MCADVVIVGGGPVGCWTAIQIKKRNPDLSVRIYERHPEYVRNHMMTIARASFLKHSKQTKDEGETAFFKAIGDIQNHVEGWDGKVKNGLPETVHVRTLDLEKVLKAECARLGVETVYEKIASPQDVMDRHPECRKFIAADGAKSGMRKALLGDDDTTGHDLLPSIDITYQSAGQPDYLTQPTFDKLDHIIAEHIGREENGKTQVSLRMLVDDDTFKKFPEANFKNPYTFLTAGLKEPDRDLMQEAARIERHRYRFSGNYEEQGEEAARTRALAEEKPQWIKPKKGGFMDDGAAQSGLAAIAADLEKFMALRAEQAGDQYIPGSEKINKIKLSIYASRKFALKVDAPDRKADWFFVGDAAMGMPFYRAINNGLMTGSQLAGIITSPLLPNALKTTFYQATRPVRLAQEYGRVYSKWAGISAFRYGVRPAMRVLKGTAFVAAAIPALLIVGGFMLASSFAPGRRGGM